MDWLALTNLQAWSPLRDLPTPVLALSGSLFSLGSDQYVFAVPYNGELVPTPDGPRVTLAIWAASDGAALRALEMRIEEDDLVIRSPPDELLPPRTMPTYRAIRSAARRDHPGSLIESAAYRLATDGRLIHREIHYGLAASYYFRSRSGLTEAPYAISWRLGAVSSCSEATVPGEAK